MSERRFQINPEPLRSRSAIPQPDYDAGRCEAIAKHGLRCQWDGKEQFGGKLLCGVHLRAAKRAAASSDHGQDQEREVDRG